MGTGIGSDDVGGEVVSTTYDATEQEVIMRLFARLLYSVTKDGGAKREAGKKPPWWRDDSHEAAMFSHLNRWEHDERIDPDSGVHPLVHLAWRALAIAYIETYGQIDPGEGNDESLHQTG